MNRSDTPRVNMTRASVAILGLISLAAVPLIAQQFAQDPKQIVREAVNTEMRAAKTDDSHWRYRDEERHLGLTSLVIETPQGTVKQAISHEGRPLTSAERSEAESKMRSFVGDREAQRKQQRDAANDDKQAQEFLQMLPNAYVWTIRSSDASNITLEYTPDPSFHAPSMEARVMGGMSGEMIVDKAQHRIRTIKGHLNNDVALGWGILGKLKAGGTFDVERRQVASGIWEITSTSVHINGHALFFKSIAENQDDVKSDFVEVPNNTTLQQAANMLEDMVNKEGTGGNSVRAER